MVQLLLKHLNISQRQTGIIPGPKLLMWDKVTQIHQTLCCVFQNVIIVLASFCVASSGYSVVATDANNIFKHNYVILNYEAIILVLLILLPLLGFHIICKTGF